jgi:hypothetical protein
VRIEADCLGSARREHVERQVGRRRSAGRLCLANFGPARPNQFGSKEALHVERWKAVGNLLGRLPLVADELEHVAISVFHTTTVLVLADDSARASGAWYHRGMHRPRFVTFLTRLTHGSKPTPCSQAALEGQYGVQTAVQMETFVLFV